MKAFLLCLLFFAGCTKPAPTKDVVVFPDEKWVIENKPVTKEEKPVVVEPEKPTVSEHAFRMTAPKNIVDAVRQVLGDSGSVPPQKDLPIVAGGTKVTIHPGATIDYTYLAEEDSMKFVFNEPRPTVEAGFSIFKIHPPLLSLILSADNVGTATVQTAVGKIERKFSINWQDELLGAQVKEEKKGPVLRFHTMKGFCPPCNVGKKELAEAKAAGKLPFDYEITEDSVDQISTSRPVLTCESMGKTWTPTHAADDPKTGAKKGDFRPGWYGVDDAIAWWKQVPKEK